MVDHFRTPLSVSAGRFGTVEQDSVDEIAQNVSVIVGTPYGSRLEVPEFGVDPSVFDVTADDVTAAVREWEPRVSGVSWETGVVDDVTGLASARLTVDTEV